MFQPQIWCGWNLWLSDFPRCAIYQLPKKDRITFHCNHGRLQPGTGGILAPDHPFVFVFDTTGGEQWWGQEEGSELFSLRTLYACEFPIVFHQGLSSNDFIIPRSFIRLICRGKPINSSFAYRVRWLFKVMKKRKNQEVSGKQKHCVGLWKTYLPVFSW